MCVNGRDAPSRPGRKAHNCCLSGGTRGVSPDKGRSAAQDARSAVDPYGRRSLSPSKGFSPRPPV